jgi:ligand-binding sensor domain-containing protein/DNA-binding CsgD family transcriptional regulator
MLVLFVVMALMPGGIDAQNTIGLPLIRNFKQTDFRAGSQTWEIDQDTGGRMYFANNEGLLTFDGSYWKLYPLPNKTIMRSVVTHKSGRVFVGGQGEAGYFEADKSGFLRYHSLLGFIPEAERSFADVWDIETKGDAVYFRTSDRIFEWLNNAVKVYRAPNEWLYLKVLDDHLLAQDSRQGLYQLSGGQWVPVPNGGLVSGDAIQGAMVISKNVAYLATIQNQLYEFTRAGLAKKGSLTQVAGNTFAMEGLNAEEFVVGTSSEGLFVIHKDGKLVQKLSINEGLIDNSILSLFIDRDGNLWTGLNHGISMIAYNAPVKFIRPNKTYELSGYATMVHKGHLYLGTSYGAYTVPLADTDMDLAFWQANFQFVKGSDGIVYHFDEINQQLLMAHNEGTFVIDKDVASKISPEASWAFVPLSTVMPTENVLVGNYFGLKRLQYSNNRFTAFPNMEGVKESFRFIAIDNDQSIWASHPYRGIYRMQLSPGLTSYTHQLYTEKEGLPSALDNHVFSVKNRVVFATDQGVYEFDKQQNKFVRSAFLWPALGATPVRYLKEDADGNIWFVSGKRLGVLVPKTGNSSGFTVTYFPEVTGQILSGFENVMPFNPQNIFVGSERGVIHINLEKYLRSKRTPALLLSAVRVLGNSDSLVSEGFANMSGGFPTEILVKGGSMPYRFNSIHFEYSSPAFGYQDNVEYSYMLEGYDAEWSKWSLKTEKDYTNLPYGSYKFKVKVKSNLGAETERVLYTFSINPPWHRTIYAYIVYGLLLVGFGYAMRYWHKKRLRRQQQKFEEKQAQLRILHELELEHNEKEIMRLQNEKLANEVVYKNKELAESTMHLVERTDALSKVKEELQRLYKTTPTNVDIKKAINLLAEIERNNSDWDRFAASFDEVNNGFLKKLKARYPVLTVNDLKICAYLQLKMSSKEIAQLLNISIRGVEIGRYRLRKKLELTTDTSLYDFLESIG